MLRLSSIYERKSLGLQKISQLLAITVIQQSQVKKKKWVHVKMIDNQSQFTPWKWWQYLKKKKKSRGKCRDARQKKMMLVEFQRCSLVEGFDVSHVTHMVCGDRLELQHLRRLEINDSVSVPKIWLRYHIKI